jgi:hypothetical protein
MPGSTKSEQDPEHQHMEAGEVRKNESHVVIPEERQSSIRRKVHQNCHQLIETELTNSSLIDAFSQLFASFTSYRT